MQISVSACNRTINTTQTHKQDLQILNSSPQLLIFIHQPCNFISLRLQKIGRSLLSPVQKEQKGYVKTPRQKTNKKMYI